MASGEGHGELCSREVSVDEFGFEKGPPFCDSHG